MRVHEATAGTTHVQAAPPATAGPPGAASRATPARALAAVFLAVFLPLLGLLLARNHVLFSAVAHEQGDYAANSILVEQAKHFDLLVGNYSRLGFSHPGPAFLYWQALGESVFYDWLPVVPARWDAQWLALLILSSALVALSLTIVASWVRSAPRVALCAAAALLFLCAHGRLLSMPWMPYLYGPPFLLLLVAAASVAAGRTSHLWALALAGGLLVHGHAEFLLFVPVVVGYALVSQRYGRRRRRAPDRTRRRDWLWPAAIVAMFLLPIVLNLALHWPGPFGRYLSYGGEHHSHGVGDTLAFVLRSWAGDTSMAAVLAVVLFGGAAVLARLRAASPEHGFLAAGLRVAVLVTVLFTAYVARGVDDLGEDYVGYFFQVVPLFLVLLVTLGLSGLALRRRRPVSRPVLVWGIAVVPLLAAAGLAVRAPSLAYRADDLPDAPRVVATLADRAAGRSVVVDLDDGSWPVLAALVVEGDRAGQRVCARDPAWRFIVTSAFVCTDRDLARGCPVRLNAQPPRDATVLARLGRTTLSAPRLPAGSARPPACLTAG